MRAILPGRPQSKRQALCTAHWDGLRLVAYISGETAIISSGPRTILQTIHIDDATSLTAITIDESSGRIAICGKSRIHIYNPVGRQENDLRWAHAHEINASDDGIINCLSWGSDEELLVSGSQLWLYHLPRLDIPRLMWEQQIANPVSFALFSNDAELIATCGYHDRLVKIWRRLSHELESARFDVSYLRHPGIVTNIYWRKPWHVEQNLDSLLYTICDDNQIRLWTYTDTHSLSVMQCIATVDANMSIQPRRLSTSSISKHRYIAILDSRDFSQATERALQTSRQTQVDHALEHLVEVANRSPEICVVLDGLGHMSVWGLENAGCKSKSPASVFNIALVDDVKIQLKFQHDQREDYIQFCFFAGGADPASLSVLVHSFAGQIDWYESPIATFFDTSAKQNRVQLVSSWSGHDLSIDHIARSCNGQGILSWTDEGQVINWSQTSSGALRRKCEASIGQDVLSVLLFDELESLVVLHENFLSLWSLARSHGSQIISVSIDSAARPTRLLLLRSPPSQQSPPQQFIVCFESGSFELWQLWLPQYIQNDHTVNGSHDNLVRVGQLDFVKSHALRHIPCDVSKHNQSTHLNVMVDRSGCLYGYETGDVTTSSKIHHTHLLVTNIEKPALARATSQGVVAMTDLSGRTLYVWNISQEACEWQYDFKGSESIQKIAWMSTPGGSLLLFVSFSYHALVLGQAQYGYGSGSSSWCVLQDISLREFTTSYIGDVSWLISGDLAIGAGNQLFVLDCTVDDGLAHPQQLSTKKTLRNSVAVAVDSTSYTRPVFQVDFLQNLLFQNKNSQVRELLLSLYEKLKYFSEGDLLDSFLDAEPRAVLESKQPDLGNAKSSEQLEEVEDAFKEYILQANIPQLPIDERERLAAFLTNFIAIERSRSSLDDNGLRYLYALQSIPVGESLPWNSFMFASRSTSQQALLELIAQRYENKMTWEVARHTGIFVWLTELSDLQAQFENVARAEYTKPEDRNPVDCSLYYLALNKKSVLQGLWRRTVGVRERDNTMKLLANNFDDPKWKATAMKNAYALLSRRRFEYAAAFFLLGGALKDAVNVCVNQLSDVQLAIAIARVWDKDRDQSQQVVHDLLKKTVLKQAIDSIQGRWMASYAYQGLRDIPKAIQSIVRPLHDVVDANLEDYSGPVQSMFFQANDPSILTLYIQLRDNLVQQGKWTKEVLTLQEEQKFIMRNVRWYIRAGLDLMALDLVSTWKFIPHQSPSIVEGRRLSVTEKISSANEVAVMDKDEDLSKAFMMEKQKKKDNKPAPTQFVEPSASSLLDSFGF